MQESVHIGVEVFVGVDIAKGDHYACAVSVDGTEVLARSVCNDEASIDRLIDDAAAQAMDPNSAPQLSVRDQAHDVARICESAVIHRQA